MFRICKAAGMPKGVVLAYEAYIENLKVYNCVVGGMGTPYVRVCGIPQGCFFLDDHVSTRHEAIDYQDENVRRYHMLHFGR